MLARRQELNTQLQVLIDAFLLALSLWAAYALRCSFGAANRRTA